MKYSPRYLSAKMLLCFLLTVASSHLLYAQTLAFTYQGRLTDGAQAANGEYQMQFTLWNSAVGGAQIGTTIADNNVQLVNGIFTVQLNFGANALTGADRFLQIAVKKPAEADFTVLQPRTQITSSPYAVKTLSATTADGLSNLCVGCVDDAKISSVAVGKVTGVLPVTKGGTGSNTKNFVDLSTDQIIGGDKTFSGNISTSGSGFRPKNVNDNSHEIFYNSGIDGLEFRGFAGFTWRTGTSGNTERMRMLANGNVGIGTDNPADKLDVRGNIRLGGNGDLFATSGEENLRIIRGRFRVADNTVTVVEGAGFTALRLLTGKYLVVFNQPFTSRAVVTIGVSSQFDKNAVLESVEADRFALNVYEAGTLSDPSFLEFIAIGRR